MRRRSAFDYWVNLPAGLIALSGVLFALALVLIMSARVNDGDFLTFAFTADNFTDALTDPLFPASRSARW